MNPRSKVTLVFFFLSLFLGYSHWIIPYYVKIFAKDQISIIGDLNLFQEPCTASPRKNSLCKHKYRIPSDLLKTQIPEPSLGLGIFIHTLEITCGRQPIAFGDISETGKIFESLNKFQTLTLASFPCDKDLIIESWAPLNANRSGVTSGITVLSSQKWIDRIKQLTEWFSGTLLFNMAGIVLLLQVMLILTQGITRQYLVTSPFETYVNWWIALIFLMSGLVFDLFIPIDIGNRLIPKTQVFLALVAMFGPILLFFASQKKLTFIKRTSSFLVSRNSLPFKIPLFFIIFLAIAASESFPTLYKNIFLVAGALTFIVSLSSRNLVFGVFSICIILDGLKMYDIPYLPVSRMAGYFSFFIIAHHSLQKLTALYKHAGNQDNYNFAVQVAHDIKGPLTSLKLVKESLNTSDSVDSLFRSAVERINDISDALLLDFKTNQPEILYDTEMLVSGIENLIQEKKSNLEENRFKTLTVSSNLKSIRFLSINKTELYRVISNSLDNSLKSISNSGKVEVTLKEQSDSLQILIIDNGSGIPEFMLNHLNEINSPLLDQTHYTGYGLGHSYNKRVLQKAGGKITVSSNLGVGTTVVIEIPFKFSK